MNKVTAKKKTERDYNEKLCEARINLAIARHETFPQRFGTPKKRKKK